MAQAWRTVPVFISSTFRDMQAERDYLVRFVFPRLREELLRRRLHFVDVDLRWGVTSEQDAVEVCREVIDECRPRFLCMLGGRYGWVPPGAERSITADEVHYAALDHPEADEYRFFYFRDPSATASVPDEIARRDGYREFPTRDEVRRHGANAAQRLADERTLRLEALKEAVGDAGLPTYTYSCEWDPDRERFVGLHEFGERVYADLLNSIIEELGDEPAEELDWLEQENAAQEVFIEQRTSFFVLGSRQKQLDRLTEFCEGSGEPNVMVLTGEPGSGKSALLAHFCREYADTHPDDTVVAHFVGAGPRSTNVRDMLLRLCEQLATASGTETDAGGAYDEVVTHFAPALAEARGKRVVIILDALNQLDPEHNAHSLHWLPQNLPEHVRVIVSCLPHPALDALWRREPPPPPTRWEYLLYRLRYILRGPQRVWRLFRATQSDRVVLEIAELATRDERTQRVKQAILRLRMVEWFLEALREDGLGESVIDAQTQVRRRQGDADQGRRDHDGRRVSQTWCDALEPADAVEIAARYLWRYRKRLDDRQRRLLLGKRDAGNPLYLTAALHELRTLGVYEQVTERIRDLPPTAPGLFAWILERLVSGIEGQEPFGERLVAAFTGSIALARGGLTEPELEAVCARHGDEGEFWPLHRALRPYLARRGERVVYYHGQVEEAVHRRFLAAEHADCLHAELARMFRARGGPGDGQRWEVATPVRPRIAVISRSEIESAMEGDEGASALPDPGVTSPAIRALSELPYHLTAAGMHEDAQALVCDISFAEAKLAAGMVDGLLTDYSRLGVSQSEIGPPLRTARRYRGRTGMLCPFCLSRARVPRRLLGLVAECPHCGELSRANEFTVDSPWRPRRVGLFGTSAWLPAQDLDAGPGADAEVRPMPAAVALSALVRRDAALLRDRARLLPQLALNCDPQSGVPAMAEDMLEADGRAYISRLNKQEIEDAPTARLLHDPSGVDWCAFTPDGRRLIAADQLGHISVWDTVTWARINDFSIFAGTAPENLSGTVEVFRLCPLGTVLALGCSDGVIHVWDIDGTRPLGTIQSGIVGRPGGIADLSFAPNGSRLVALTRHGYSGGPAVAELFDVRGLRMIALADLQTGTPEACAVSPDGRSVAFFPHGGGSLVLLSEPTERELAIAEQPEGAPFMLEWSPDGQFLLWGHSCFDRDADDVLRRYNLDPPTSRFGTHYVDMVTKLAVEPHGCQRSACYSPDGKQVLRGTLFGSMELIDLAGSGRRVLGPMEMVNHVCLSPDGRLAAAACSDGVVAIWRTDTGGGTQPEQRRWCRGYLPDAHGVLVENDEAEGCQRLDRTLTEVIETWEGLDVITCSPDGARILATQASPTTDVILDRATRESTAVLHEYPDDEEFEDYAATRLSPDGRAVAGLTPEGEASLVDAEDGSLLASPVQVFPEYGFDAPRFSPDGKRLLLLGEDGETGDYTYRVAQTEDLALSSFGPGERPDWQCAVALFSPCGATIASLWRSPDIVPTAGLRYVGFLRMERLSDGEIVETPCPDDDLWTNMVPRAAVSPDGRLLAHNCISDRLGLWDIEGRSTVAIFNLRTEIATFHFHPDGSELIVGDRVGRLYRLELRSFDIGPPVLTPTRLWRFGGYDRGTKRAERGYWDERLSVLCPFHGRRFATTDSMLGELVPCPECGEALKVNPFVCDNSDIW